MAARTEDSKDKLTKQERVKNIINLARIMTRKTMPIDQIRNQKAEFKNPDKALEDTRMKNLSFDSYLKTELSKLNFPLSPSKPNLKQVSSKKLHGLKSNSEFSKHKSSKSHDLDNIEEGLITIHPILEIPSLTSQNPPNKVTNKIYKALNTKKHLKTNFQSYNDFITNSPIKKNDINKGIIKNKNLPPLIKSVPLYMDPFYSFPKKNSLEDSFNKKEKKHKRVSSLDEVKELCEDLLPKCKDEIHELKHLQYVKKKEKRRIEEYMDDLSECLRMSKDKKSFEDSLSTRVYNRKLDKEMKNDIEDLRQGILEVTRNAIEYGGQKVWRWKNTLFLANADRLINSVPIKRNS
ncbi:hypothetical protein SteCoe_29919 [Stentor coeruleus]|uniref:Uncharacterized protein n=1 Tax=Stentor coeruleus TaxID=5963 RepID=A0A1R2B525_9CILI|nr:hypothetical protein SteCoe_29919 [Stentor coeruleus]